MPVERTVPLLHRTGLHLRAAGRLAQTAGRFESEVRVGITGRSANAKSILDILTLAAGPGVNLTISAEGPDAGHAVEAIATLVQRNFDEEP